MSVRGCVEKCFNCERNTWVLPHLQWRPLVPQMHLFHTGPIHTQAISQPHYLSITKSDNSISWFINQEIYFPNPAAWNGSHFKTDIMFVYHLEKEENLLLSAGIHGKEPRWSVYWTVSWQPWWGRSSVISWCYSCKPNWFIYLWDYDLIINYRQHDMIWVVVKHSTSFETHC